ncbi:hypothetical protein [Myroides sp. DW712]|uniref:hypothetical protein n=1 Tax=Myroides sp. DW712 TaxID=3389800 RepID=UPI00397B9A0F
MKKQFIIIFMSACSLGYAQIGINTTDITSTLTVQGSISTNYREITNREYYIQKDDSNISYNGNLGYLDGVLYLPSNQNGEDAFGRIYNIKNLTTDQSLQIKTRGNQTFKFGGKELLNLSSYTLYPGQHLSVVANKDNDWVVYDYDTYVRKKVKIDNSIAENSVVHLGNFSFRIVQPNLPSSGDMYLQIRKNSFRADYITSNTNWSSLTRSNDKKEFRNIIDYSSISSGSWKYVHKDPGNKTNPVMNAKFIQSQVSIITIESIGEVYRVTCHVFDGYNIEKSVIILVERLV